MVRSQMATEPVLVDMTEILKAAYRAMYGGDEPGEDELFLIVAWASSSETKH